MPSSYQRKLQKEGAPQCKYCGLYLPKKCRERGVCDFCHEAHLDDPQAFWAFDPATDRHVDAVSYEAHGAYEPEPLPRLDSDTLAVERERQRNHPHSGGVTGGRGRRR